MLNHTAELHRLRRKLWRAEKELEAADARACEIRAKIAKVSYQFCTPAVRIRREDVIATLLPESQRDTR